MEWGQLVLALDFFMGAGAISVAFVTPVISLLWAPSVSRCAGLCLITLSAVLGSTYFLIPFFCLCLFYFFSESNAVDGVVGC